MCCNVGSIEPDVQEARIGRSQPGVGLCSPHLFVLRFFKSGLTLNPHNKRHSFGLFISLFRVFSAARYPVDSRCICVYNEMGTRLCRPFSVCINTPTTW